MAHVGAAALATGLLVTAARGGEVVPTRAGCGTAGAAPSGAGAEVEAIATVLVASMSASALELSESVAASTRFGSDAALGPADAAPDDAAPPGPGSYVDTM